MVGAIQNTGWKSKTEKIRIRLQDNIPTAPDFLNLSHFNCSLYGTYPLELIRNKL